MKNQLEKGLPLDRELVATLLRPWYFYQGDNVLSVPEVKQ